MKKVRKAVIPVAGFGTRFLPATKATPKEMFPIVDKPVAQYAVEEAVAAGIEQIIFITGQAKRAIEDHFDSNFELEHLLETKGKHDQLTAVREISDMCQFVYIRQKEMSGWGDAIALARNLIDDEPFAILMPDDVYTGSVPAIGELIAIYEETESPVIGLKEVPAEEAHRYGVATGDKVRDGLLKLTDLVEKPTQGQAPSNYAGLGRYVMTPDLFDCLDKLEPGAGGEIQGADGMRLLMQQRDMYGALMTAKRHDAGEKLGYLKAIVEIALERDDLGEEFRAFLKDCVK